jgi:hypothetical protein
MLCAFYGLLSAALGLFATGQPKAEPATQYVEFDFSTMPRDGEGNCAYTLTVLTVDRDLKYSVESKGPKKFTPDVVCAAWECSMRINSFKVEIVDKTKLRVYGQIFNDKLIPATKGIVESRDLTPDELPKVKNPESKG